MQDTLDRAFASLGIIGNDSFDLPRSTKRFADGGEYRIEIPSVEGPAALAEVLEAGKRLGVPIHRISQGSGIMMQTDDEVRAMVELGAVAGTEICLFVGPRAAWDIGMQARTASGSVVASTLRGNSQLRYATEDVMRGCELGLRGVLVADLGHLWLLAQLKRIGVLPPDLVLKVSVSMPASNAATARVLEDLGASTINLPVDLSLPQISAIRRAVEIPLDIYVEGPDDLGGPIRYYEIAEIVRVAAPVHLKFAVRNSPGIYPSGEHLAPVVMATARERVRRASMGLGILHRAYPNAKASPFLGAPTTAVLPKSR